MLKRGITREVFLIGKYAFKLPSVRNWWLFLEGLQCNMNEKERQYCSDQFCPIVFSLPGGFLNVMKRCTPLKVYDYEEMNKVFYLSKETEEGNVHRYVENKQCSFGILNGKLVAVDYGS